jgi:hypothetical protein
LQAATGRQFGRLNSADEAACHGPLHVRKIRPPHDHAIDGGATLHLGLASIARQHAAFLECLWRFGETSCDVVDLTDVVGNIGELARDRIGQDLLWTRAQELPEALHRRYLEQWRRLRSDDAPFRVVRNLELVSAPITVHDDVLLSFAGRDWCTSARLIGNVMGSGAMVGDAVLFGLLRRLVREGKLEARGDLSTMGSSKVRLPH